MMFLGGWKLRLIMWVYDFIKSRISKELDKSDDEKIVEIKQRREDTIGKAYKDFDASSDDEFLRSIERLQAARRRIREEKKVKKS